MKIGVFDSGIGGEAVAEELRRLIPEATIVSINDHEHVPYGGRPRAEIMQLTRAAIEPLVAMECDAIVIACNTATTNAIQLLRHDFPAMKFIGLEPMVKPAAILTRTKKVAVLATPATLASPRYAELKALWAPEVRFFEPDCASWAPLIENGRNDEIQLERIIRPLLEEKVDVIVLACTHYHWLIRDIEAIVGPSVRVIEPSEAIKNRIVDILN